MAIKDMLSYLPEYKINLEHIQGTLNPADVLIKSVDVSVMNKLFLYVVRDHKMFDLYHSFILMLLFSVFTFCVLFQCLCCLAHFHGV